MSTSYPIHDLFVRELKYQDNSDHAKLSVFRYDDHLLRRFGHAEFIRASDGSSHKSEIQEAADEVWALLEGTVSFSWKDKRQDSPTFDREHHQTSSNPLLLLVPFGVAFGYHFDEGEALLLRFSTHEPLDYPNDRLLKMVTNK